MELLAPPAGEPDVLPLAEPELLGVLGCAAELELELESLLLGLLGEAALAPPEAEPDFGVSLEADPLIPADELDDEPGAVGLDDAPLDGDEGEVLGEVAVLELEEPGVDEVLLVSPRSHAATPKTSATAAARIESFMDPPWVGYKEESSKLRARPNPLIAKGLSRAYGTLCRQGGTSYLLVLELLEPPGLEGFLGAPPGWVALLDSLPALPLAPDELELPGEEVAPLEVAPPDADLLPSRSHPAIRAPLRANTSAAANAVNFMLTSMGCVP